MGLRFYWHEIPQKKKEFASHLQNIIREVPEICWDFTFMYDSFLVQEMALQIRYAGYLAAR